MNIKHILLIVVITSMMSACGFQIRQAFELPAELTPVQLKVPRQYRDLAAILQEEMRAAKIPLASASNTAALIIDLRQVSEEENLLTASAAGSPLERELSLRARVYWEDADGEYVLEPEDFVLLRNFVYDDTAILAKKREAESLTRELERELSRRIILRMRQLAN